MMERSVAVGSALVALVLLGGCAGVTAPDGPTTVQPKAEEATPAEKTTELGATTVTTTRPIRTVGTTAYPERPNALSLEVARQFVVACEQAYLRNEVGTAATNVSSSIEATVEESAPGTFVVTLHVEAVIRYADGHGDVEHDAHYFVDDSTVRRTEVPPGEPVQSPRNGTDIACG